jgi:phage shock protein E
MIVKEIEGEAGRGHWVVVATVVFVALAAAYMVIAMPGMDHGSDDSMATMGSADMDLMPGLGDDKSPVNTASAVGTPVAQADPASFELLMAAPGAVVVNVHVPQQGAIPGTDASIPYNEITGHPSLPTVLDTPILVYCETGRMSSIAGEKLIAAGYSDVTQLTGGMQAWQASGRELEPAR